MRKFLSIVVRRSSPLIFAIIVAPLSFMVAHGQPYPTVIALPTGFQPEGITSGRGLVAYSGALNGGAIFRTNLRTGEVDTLVPPRADRTAVGLAFDPRSHLIFAAGGALGTAYVYQATNGEDVAIYQLTESSTTFINDVVITRTAAYFTDSFRPVLYRLPLSARGGLPEPSAIEEVPLTGDFVFIPGDFNANGIEATPRDNYLLVMNTAVGEMYRIEPDSGHATRVDLGGVALLVGGDGIWLKGHTLYVVQNFLNQIASVRLGIGFTSGRITNIITDPDLRFPTTVTGFGTRLYAVNARFNEIPPGSPNPDDEFEIVQVLQRPRILLEPTLH